MENVQNVTVLSVGQAHTLIQTADSNEVKMAIGQAVLNSDEIRGESSDYHNLAVSFTRDEDDFYTGFKIVEKGLKQYPYNIDLLADAIYYGSNAGQFEKCEEYIKQIKKCHYSRWNWRAFTFIIDYLLEKADKFGDSVNIPEITKEALILARMQQSVINDGAEAEKGYLSEYKVREMREKYFRAEALSSQQCAELAESEEERDKEEQNAIKNEKAANDEKAAAEKALQQAINSDRFSACACCLRYADILFEAQKYQETLDICQKALGFTEAQPSARLGYFLYLSAMCNDAIIHREQLYKNEDRVKEVYADYSAAYKCVNSATYQRNIKNRLVILEAKSGMTAPTFSDSKDEMLAQLLSRLKNNSDEN